MSLTTWFGGRMNELQACHNSAPSACSQMLLQTLPVMFHPWQKKIILFQIIFNFVYGWNYDGIWSSLSPQLLFLINENIHGKCFCKSLSFVNPRISPPAKIIKNVSVFQPKLGEGGRLMAWPQPYLAFNCRWTRKHAKVGQVLRLPEVAPCHSFFFW